MDYIVFDLEWNQSPNGKRYADERLPFEIIEIGAVRLSEDLTVRDTFHRLIRPKVYNWIHNSIHDVIHMDYDDLAKGSPFPEAVHDFLRWCAAGVNDDPSLPRYWQYGTDFCFCSWGTQDVMELQRNMNYYHMLSLLPGPLPYFDVQKLFSAQFEESRNNCRALEYAIDFLEIDKDHGFHRALEDAHFTAMVMQHLGPVLNEDHLSLDVYQHPCDRESEVHIERESFSRYVSREFSSREKALKDNEVVSTRCPVCRKNAKRLIRWFSSNSRTYYSISNCPEHEEITGTLRVHRLPDNHCFVEKTLRAGSAQEAEDIRTRQEIIRQKKIAARQKKPQAAVQMQVQA